MFDLCYLKKLYAMLLLRNEIINTYLALILYIFLSTLSNSIIKIFYLSTWKKTTVIYGMFQS